MAEYGEWNLKGASLGDKTAKAEYGVSEEFIVQGIRAGKLEYRYAAMHGNPYLRLLRSQLEKYVAEEMGQDYLERVKGQAELKRTNKRINELKNMLKVLEERKMRLEEFLKK